MRSDAQLLRLGRGAPRVPACDAALVQMPWASIDTPSVALGRLKAVLGGAGIASAALYLNVSFAKAVGVALYPRLVDERFTLLGEWLFAGALFDRPWDDRLLDRSGAVRGSSLTPREIRQLRRAVDDFLERAAGEVVAREPKLVVFPSMSTDTQQHSSSLALARLVKRRRPQATIVLSGNSVEGIMGLETARVFGFVDAVISGDVDEALLGIAEEVVRGRAPGPPLPGVHRQGHLSAELDDAALANTPTVDIESLPAPDHGDYFEQMEAHGLDRDRPRIIRFSTSRGCWWAQKNHCMFCSLHGKRPTYRALSTGKAQAELTSAVGEHRADLAMASDYIFNPDYFDDLVPALAAAELPVSIFYEVRPNLTKEQLSRLRDAGVNHFQAGIESFSTPLLRRIKKGSTGLQHVRFLKWAEELGLYVSWNILCGFPDADPSDYEASLRLFPLLAHLAPTAFVVDFVLQRYSPYFARREEYFRSVEPLPAYGEIYAGLDPETIGRLAYNFAGDHPGKEMAARYRDELRRALEAWKAEHEASGLFYLPDEEGEGGLLVDTRRAARQLCTRLDALAARLYAACDDIRSLGSLLRLVHGRGQTSRGVRDQVERALDDLVGRNVMLREGASYLGLALPLRGARLRPAQRDRLLEAARSEPQLGRLLSAPELCAHR